MTAPDDPLARVEDERRYRPSNGTEGMAFMDRFCDRCRRDEAYRLDEGDSCLIAAATMVFQEDEAGYPREWVYGPFGPCCTAFEPMEDGGVILDVRQIAMPWEVAHA